MGWVREEIGQGQGERPEMLRAIAGPPLLPRRCRAPAPARPSVTVSLELISPKPLTYNQTAQQRPFPRARPPAGRVAETLSESTSCGERPDGKSLPAMIDGFSDHRYIENRSPLIVHSA